QKVAVVCEQGALLQSLLREGAEEGRATQGGQVVEGSKKFKTKCVEPFTSTSITSPMCPRKGGHLPVTGLSV
ncbi:hypothetical protein AMECASPLE_021353, partial [Ameca splendens]